MKPEFHNRPNECVTTNDGRQFFISRSPAVIPQIFCLVEKSDGDELLILVNRRGPGCPDRIGRWALPCGYLDWDEDAIQAARREVFEECDFDVFHPEVQIGAIPKTFWSMHLWKLVTDPKQDGRQNILIHLTHAFSTKNSPPKVTKMPDLETTEVVWMPVAQALQTRFAFGHEYNIYECLYYVIKNETLPWQIKDDELKSKLTTLAYQLLSDAPCEVKKVVSERQ